MTTHSMPSPVLNQNRYVVAGQLPFPFDIARYYVTQTNNTGIWGKVKKILVVVDKHLLLCDPSTLVPSHVWPWNRIAKVSNIDGQDQGFTLTVMVEGKDKKGLREKGYNFTCRYRALLMTDIHDTLAKKKNEETKYYAGKVILLNNDEKSVLIGVTNTSISVVYSNTFKSLININLQAIHDAFLIDTHGQNEEFVIQTKVTSGNGVAISSTILSCIERDDLVKSIELKSNTLIGMPLKFKKSNMTINDFHQRLKANQSAIETAFANVESVCDYRVIKISSKEPGAVFEPDKNNNAFTLSVSSNQFLVERTVDTYGAVTARHLSNISVLIRFTSDAQKLGIEYRDGSGVCYLSTSRDVLLAVILDMTQCCQGVEIAVLPDSVDRSLLLEPVHALPEHREDPADAKRHLRIFCQNLKKERLQAQSALLLTQVGRVPSGGIDAEEKALPDLSREQFLGLLKRIAQFNACTPYSGLPVDSRVMIETLECVCELLPKDGGKKPTAAQGLTQTMALQALRRLMTTRTGCTLFANVPFGLDRLFASISSGDDGVAADASHVLTAIIRRTPSPYYIQFLKHQNPGADLSELFHNKEMQLEKHNKELYLEKAGGKDWGGSVKGMSYRQLIIDRIQDGVYCPLLTFGLVEVLECVLCAPYSDTSSDLLFYELLTGIGELKRSLFRLFTHPASTVATSVGIIMKTIAEEIPSSSSGMKEAAMAEAAVLRHFYIGIFSPYDDQRFVSRQLVSIWCDGYKDSLSLMSRILPPGLTGHLRRPVEEVAVEVAPAVSETASEDENLVAAQEEGVSPAPLEGHMEEAIDEDVEDSGAEKGEWDIEVIKKKSKKNMVVARDAGVAAAGKALAYATRLKTKAGSGSINIEMWYEFAEEKGLKEKRIRKRPINDEVAIKKEDRQNWNLLFTHMDRDHRHSKLIWNEETRVELKEALENEIDYWEQEQQIRGGKQISWNHAEFKVIYKSLRSEVMVGDYYLGLLLDGHNNGEPVNLEAENAPKFFSQLYHRLYVETDPVIRQLCVRGMAAIYEVYSVEIGFFHGTAHITSLIDTTLDRKLRHLLILLLRHLLQVPENAEIFMDADGVELLVQLLSTVHEQTDRPPVPIENTMMITDSENAGEYCIKVWFYWDAANKLEMGPVSKKEMATLYTERAIGSNTLVWIDASKIINANMSLCPFVGKAAARPLSEIRELRWSVASFGTSILSTQSLSLTIMGILNQLCKLRANTDKNGDPLRPVPRAQRLVAGPTTLPLLAQTLLAADPSIVDTTSSLLLLVAEHSDRVMSRLYSSGVYYYCMMFSGSNFFSISRFLKETHCSQHFFGVESASSNLPIHKRSVLGSLLPQSMIYALESKGPVEFANLFVDNSDTPEVVWHHKMRGYLISQISQHIGDFPRYLPECTTLIYDYLPIPSIVFKELKHELWCHKYYLKNLCDIQRFPNFKVVDLIETMQSILQLWSETSSSVDQKKGEMTTDEARELLNVDKTVTESQLKSAYRRLALKYHPDKNPQGGQMFQKVNAAYEMLVQNVDEEDERLLWRLELILSSQSILYQRHSEELSPFKYAGYTMLMKEIQLYGFSEPTISQNNAPILKAALDLAFYTCVSSPLNGEELDRQNGVKVFCELLEKCQSSLGDDYNEADPSDNGLKKKQYSEQETMAYIAVYTMLSLSGLANVKNARSIFIQNPAYITLIGRSLRYLRLPRLIEATLTCFKNLLTVIDSDQKSSKESRQLQTLILKEGILWMLIPYVVRYDPALRLDEAELIKGKDTNIQMSYNYQAILAADGLHELTTLRGAADCIEKLLSPGLYKLLADEDYLLDKSQFFHEVGSVVANPLVLWNHNTRSQLTEFCQQQLEKGRDMEGNYSISPALTYKCKEHEKELTVNDIFVRLFIANPLFELEDRVGFAHAMMDYIDKNAPIDKDMTAMNQHMIEMMEKQNMAFSPKSARPQQRSSLSGTNSFDMTPPLKDGSRPASYSTKPLTPTVVGAETPPEAYTTPDLSPLRKDSGNFSTASSSSSLNADNDNDDNNNGKRFYNCEHIASVLQALNVLIKGQPEPHELLSQLAQSPISISPVFRCLNIAEQEDKTDKEKDLLIQNCLELISALVSSGICTQALSNDFASIVRLCRLLYTHEPSANKLLDILRIVASNQKVAWELVIRGGVLYLLNVIFSNICKSTGPSSENVISDHVSYDTRAISGAKVLAKMAGDRTHGAKITLVLAKYIPSGMTAVIRDNPESLPGMLRSKSATPELIWNSDMLQQIYLKVKEQSEVFYKVQSSSWDATWEMPKVQQFDDGFDTSKRITIAGVHLDLFLKDPKYPLRRPKAFLEGLFVRYIEINVSQMQNSEMMQIVATAIISLLRVQPLLCDHVATLGYLGKLCDILRDSTQPKESPNVAVCDSITSIFLTLAQSRGCVEDISTSATFIPGLKGVIEGKGIGDHGISAGMETFKLILNKNNNLSVDTLVQQVVHHKFVEFLLYQLDWSPVAENAPSRYDLGIGKVHVIDALKMMSEEGHSRFSQTIQHILDESSVWDAYKSQRHDLYLPSNTDVVAGYLKGAEMLAIQASKDADY